MWEKIGIGINRVFVAIVIIFVSNYYSLTLMIPLENVLGGAILIFIFINLIPSFSNCKFKTRKLRNSADGCELLILFLITTMCSLVYSIFGWCGGLPVGTLLEEPKHWLLNSLFIFLTEVIVFWNGMMRIYITSAQLGMRWRVIGALCGMIPIVNLLVLGKLIRVVKKEVIFENEKIVIDEKRKEQAICATKYPLLLVHGVFFRDSDRFNYWGRIPEVLERNGANIFYGNHASASSVADSARELDQRIRQIVKETGCEKVNIIAHSKGGLDCRYALSQMGTDDYVASLTTINTPHRGCKFADYLLSKIPEKQKKTVASAYNLALKKVGDENPDFLVAVKDLTEEACARLNEQVKDSEEVYYQSVGSKLSRFYSGRFPLNFSYHMVNYFEGANDGLVAEESFSWGESYRMVTARGTRGISHGDMIDLNRENFDGFDVREFYVNLVSELKEKGF